MFGGVGPEGKVSVVHFTKGFEQMEPTIRTAELAMYTIRDSAHYIYDRAVEY